MKDYERYMNRQKVSDAGMETLLKLETERPERPVREESRVPQWLKYVGMAACFCLMMGLFALPILQGAQQQRAAGSERAVTGELHFNELDDVPLLSGRAAEKGDTVTSMDKEALYALFGKTARWPDMGWEKYFTVSGQRRDKADGTREYALWGSDNVAGFSSQFGTRSSGVWLELTENGAFFEEEWKGLTVSVINSCEVVAVIGRNEEKGMYRAAAVFQTVGESGPYGVFYAVETTSEVYAKRLVSQMADYLTANGIFTQEREILSVKFSGWYVMETDGKETWPSVPSVTFNEDGSFGVFVAYCSSHICQGDYEITDGRVTVRCPQHTYVFDILDEETLRFVGAESSEPEHYGDDDCPKITDGAVFRLQEILFGEEENVTATEVVGPYYLEVEDADEGSFRPVITFYQDGKFQCISDLASSHYCVGPYTVKNGRVTANCDQHRFVFDIDGDDLRYVGAESDKMARFIAPEVTDGAVFRRPDGAEQWGRTYEFSPFRYAISPRAALEPAELGGRYHMEAADGSALASSYLEIERNASQQDAAQKMTVHFASRNCACDAAVYNTTRDRITYVCSECKSVYTFDIVDSETLRYVASGNKDCIDDCTVFRHLKDGERANTTALKPQVEPSGVFYLESAEEGMLVYPYLNLNENGNTFSWWRGEESSRSGSYAVADGKVRCYKSGKTYLFDVVDENTLRFVGTESDALDYLDAGRTTRTLLDGAVLRRNDAQLGALDGERVVREYVWDVQQATHHPEPSHHSGHH